VVGRAIRNAFFKAILPGFEEEKEKSGKRDKGAEPAAAPGPDRDGDRNSGLG